MLNTINTRILVRFLKTTLSSTRYTLSSQIVIIHWARAVQEFCSKPQAIQPSLYCPIYKYMNFSRITGLRSRLNFSRLIINSPPLKTFNFYYR
ncbi:uncharacterized protein OCT59_017970 [Rhizophagus irregularis]|uniref:uncharacterized protein n=1 Tax=Rhizophagus irregularis TaxID=588596 RepID=UPI000CC3E407|nr:hypothetical protein OCT59_017970 [Rhizophagus irregularis]GBC41542.1 hypothetical protein RIR_jg9140.t1 [Rhizophagus irregularis DAOM 181602=DAOM 197198]